MASIARKARRQKSDSKNRRKNERRPRRRSKKNRRRAQRPAPLPGPIARIVGALFAFFAGAFTRPTWQRFVVLLFAAILTTGSRTISNLLRTVDLLAPGDPSSYHRVMSKRCWSIWRLSRALASFIFARWVPEGTIQLAGDDTVAEHKGKKVFGKGCHRDAVRSTHSFTAFRWGHKWVVLAVLVKFPFATRPGRPRKKGRKQPKPEAVVKRAKRKRLHVTWYGGGERNIEIVTRDSHWYKAGVGLVPVRWVFVHDRSGTHRDEYFFSTDVELSA